MLLELFSLLLLIFILCFVLLVFWLFCDRKNCFSGSIYSEFCGLLVYISFFKLGKFSSIILLKIFTGPLSWKSSFLSILIILRFGLLIVSWICWMFWVRIFLHFTFSLIVVSMFSMVSSVPEILSSISLFCLLCLHLWLLTSFLGFLLSELSPFVISLLFLFPFLDPGWCCSILSTVWMCSTVIL